MALVLTLLQMLSSIHRIDMASREYLVNWSEYADKHRMLITYATGRAELNGRLGYMHADILHIGTPFSSLRRHRR